MKFFVEKERELHEGYMEKIWKKRRRVAHIGYREKIYGKCRSKRFMKIICGKGAGVTYTIL